MVLKDDSAKYKASKTAVKNWKQKTIFKKEDLNKTKGRDAHNQRNRNQAIDFDSYKITAPNSD